VRAVIEPGPGAVIKTPSMPYYMAAHPFWLQNA